MEAVEAIGRKLELGIFRTRFVSFVEHTSFFSKVISFSNTGILQFLSLFFLEKGTEICRVLLQTGKSEHFERQPFQVSVPKSKTKKCKKKKLLRVSLV